MNYTEEQRTTERFNRACKGKRIFETKVDAKAEARRLRKRFSMKMKAYHCSEFCGKYHLGHNRHGNQKTYLELVEIVDHQKRYGN